ncbi:hypothetical protein EV651_11147 [Kribbella sp. VKM Ac-2571]|uniref:hypothetical protein n=1 Tax=Kribbella sp. VKM Ac-2571 TaxID=2512222 RepID=UPI00105CA247|nr:hypothetical protein [Kribbella sp. VKM Ac-2571]TDO57323.1 hypothetical protein EV651_11147 [Kribbella sp. VKM Ac-2571]
MTTLTFPIGHCLGTVHAAGSHVQQVRLGGEIVDLADEEFAVWALAHALTGGRGPLIDSLLARNLLVEVDVNNPAGFAERHRLLPLNLGLGNTPELPAMFKSGTTDLELAGMTRTLYDLWLWGHLSPNLLIACKEHNADLTAVVTALHALLAPSAACLDLAVQEY